MTLLRRLVADVLRVVAVHMDVPVEPEGPDELLVIAPDGDPLMAAAVIQAARAEDGWN
jgi:hypothetical protein